MKRTFTRALTLSCFIGAMMGCAKNDLLSTANNNEVSFSTHVDGTTKGTTKVEFKIGDQFGLMATESATDWSNADANWYMGGGTNTPTVVTNTPSSNGAGVWKYSPIKLWPEVNKVSFFAYSPISDGANGISNVQATAGSPTLDFAVSDDVKQQIDLLRAEALNKYAEEVQLAFSHALTRVTFAAKANVTANQRVRLDKIELKGIQNSGTLKLYDDARVVGALNDMGGWSAQAGAADYDLALTHEVASLVPSTLVPMTEDDQALFMIPQEFTGGSVLAVTYSYSNDNGKKWVNGSKFDIDLKEYTQYWNPSKNYRYVLTLSPENMYSFSADIVEWDTEIDLNVKDVLSISTLEVDPTGGKPHEVIVTETRGEALGYTLKSSDATWITVSDATDGTYAGEVAYAADGTVTTKAYEMEKKWYIKVEPNTTGASRAGYVELIREGAETLKLEVKQVGGLPFKDVVAPTLPAYMITPVYKVEGMVVPNHKGAKYKLKTVSDWYTLSLDGRGDGVKELTVVGNASDAPVDFYIHAGSDITRAEKSADIVFEAVNSDVLALEMGKITIKQDANSEYFVGNFAGKIVNKSIGSEVHYYFDKLLFAANADESSTLQWQSTASATGVVDKWNGKANTLALKNLGETPAAKACWNKVSTPANEWYLPAQNQLLGMWIAKPALGTLGTGDYWSSNEQPADLDYEYAWSVTFNSGNTFYSNKKVTSHAVRCVRENGNGQIVANKVIKGADGKVYIDVQNMLAGAWSATTLNSVHTETSATNSLFKKIEVDKSDDAFVIWDEAKANCAAKGTGWRLPTHRELILIWIMKDALVQAGVAAFADGDYTSSTLYNRIGILAWAVNFDKSDATIANRDDALNVRCIREVN